MTPIPIRCAIYTRKSSEEGLEQAFNSLDAQREACAAFIESQKNEGWQLLPAIYDDGGISGGTMERPALRQLLQHVCEHRVDVIVVYKVDRLTRSLADFSKIVDILDTHNASFVSVTQQFNTSTSMGRLTLNVLLSFAQFEREVTGERIRDKLAATAKKGMRLGGVVPLGYDLRDREMVVNTVEARQVNHIFDRYVALKCVAKLKAELDRDGRQSKVRVSKKGIRSGGHRFTRGALYRILQNRIYLGKIVHKGTAYPGNHQPIVDQNLWDQVQQNLLDNRTTSKLRSRAKDPSLLSGLVFDERGNAFSPTHAVKNGKRYRYYVNQALIQFRPEDAGAVRRIAAHEVEQLVCNRLHHLFRDPTQLADLLDIPDDHRETLMALQAGADQLALAWEELPSTDRKILVQRIVTRMVILSSRVELLISWQGLADALGVSIAPNGQAETISLSLDAQFRRIGGETKLVLQGSVADPPPGQSDPVLLHALAQAHAWSELYRREPTLPMAYFAGRAHVSESYATRILRLAFLAPDIVEAIVAGKQPRSLTLKRLLREIPLSWAEQRERFGIRQA